MYDHLQLFYLYISIILEHINQYKLTKPLPYRLYSLKEAVQLLNNVFI
jgi:hypothetical protein